MKEALEVLIVGAGPTGLMMACQLAMRDIPFLIIDINEDHTTQSRALGIHAATMEVFAQMGIADRFLTQGKPAKAINALVNGKGKRVPLSDIGQGLTQFPFMLALEQSKTEKLLIEFLAEHSKQVMWNTELVSFTQTKENVKATLKQKNGNEEIITVNWLVGTDGAKSVVRHILNLPFGGETYPLDLFVLDCKIDWQLKNDELYLAFSNESFALFFPLPEDTCRVIGLVPKKFTGKADLQFEDVNKRFAERIKLNVRLHDPKWISAYRAHHRYVSEFKKGRCFLAGDAAHIHSPVGAQGMNTGLQDATNLAWKLALVIKKQAKESILDTYQDERLPFARQLVKTTDRAFNIVVSQSAGAKFIRLHIAPQLLAMLVKIKPLAQLGFKNISQIGITYSEGLLYKEASFGSFSSRAPKPGQRVPFIEFEDADGKRLNLQQLVTGYKMHLFIFPGSNSENNKSITGLIKKYRDMIATDTIALNKNTEALYEKLGIKKEGCYLVRPDLYIAYRSNGFNVKHLEDYLASFFIASDKNGL